MKLLLLHIQWKTTGHNIMNKMTVFCLTKKNDLLHFNLKILAIFQDTREMDTLFRIKQIVRLPTASAIFGISIVYKDVLLSFERAIVAHCLISLNGVLKTSLYCLI